MDLNDLRGQIDALDQQLLALFEQRMEIAARIGQYKKSQNLPVLNAAREQQIIAKIHAAAQPELADYAADFFTSLFKISRAYQETILSS